MSAAANALASFENRSGLHRVVLHAVSGGVMAFAFERADSAFAEQDYFLASWSEAKAFADDEWGVPATSWVKAEEQPD